jgi:hypothetical protein
VKSPSKRRAKKDHKRHAKKHGNGSDCLEQTSLSTKEGIRMANIETLNGEFKVTGARRIVANNTAFSPAMPASNTCSYTIEFPSAAAKAPKAMTSSITRILPGGTTQQNSIVVSAEAKSPVTLPLGVFPGRKVSYTVIDNVATGNRVVSMAIESLDATGINEQWRHQVSVILTPGDITNFALMGPKGLTIDSVDVTP